VKKGKLFVISGPSGSGKTTLAQALLKDPRLSARLKKSVSFTTRGKRKGEKQGRDYFFISEVEFRKRLKAKKILEWTRYLGYYYGTDREYIDRQLITAEGILLCIDIKGARSIRRLYPADSVLLFIKPPSLAELKRRINKRCALGEEEVRERLAAAKKELGSAAMFDYRVINKDFKLAVKRLKGIISSELK